VPMLRLLHEAGSVAISSGRGVSTARVRLDSR
jgi:hypothetical protein